MAEAPIRSRYSSKASRPASSAAGLGQPVQHPALLGPERWLEELAGAGRPPPGGRPASARRILLAAQVVVLLGIAEPGAGDLGHLVAQDVGLPGPLLLVAPELGHRRRRSPAVGPGGARPAPRSVPA